MASFTGPQTAWVPGNPPAGMDEFRSNGFSGLVPEPLIFFLALQSKGFSLERFLASIIQLGAVPHTKVVLFEQKLRTYNLHGDQRTYA